MKALVATTCALALGGCMQELSEFNREPQLSQVGAGLTSARAPLPVGTPPAQPVTPAFNSIYSRYSEDLFRDSRAMRVGDVITVKISMNDKAKLDNNTNRSRNSSTTFGLDFLAGFSKVTNPISGNVSGDAHSDSSSRGRGQIDRSEEVNFSVAAVVTELLPNGNLVISGSQEIRVNYDIRVVNVAGIVRPRDISGNNTIAYDKIAEARIAYGGRGRNMEVQQPPWGQQVYDKVAPF